MPSHDPDARLSPEAIQEIATCLFPPHVRAAVEAIVFLDESERKWLQALIGVTYAVPEEAAPPDWMCIDAEICLELAESEPDWIASEWPHQDEAKHKLLAILRIVAVAGRP